MWHVLRIALMWLIAAALPWQGLAAATMSCDAVTHRAAAAVDAHAPHEAHAHEHAGHHHAHDLVKAADHKGNACASCCAAAVLPAHDVAFEPVAAAQPLFGLASCGAAAFLTGGLERPPRTILA